MRLYICKKCQNEQWRDDENPLCCEKVMCLVAPASGNFSYAMRYPVYTSLKISEGMKIADLNTQYKLMAKRSFKQLSYGQHLSCSGDRYGMFYALSLFTDSSVSFFCAADEQSIKTMLGFTQFYASGLIGLNYAGYKIVPILTQGDDNALSTNEFRKLKSELENSAKNWVSLRNEKEDRIRDLNNKLAGKQMEFEALSKKQEQIIRTTKDKFNPASEEPGFQKEQETKLALELQYIDSDFRDPKIKLERQIDAIEEQIGDYHRKCNNSMAQYKNAKKAAQSYYAAKLIEQNSWATMLQQEPGCTPFVWTNAENLTWRGGNQLYSESSEPKTIAPSTKLSIAAKLIQPHPALKIISIGKCHLHLNKLLEKIGGKKFAAATKYAGTCYLATQIPSTVEKIKIEAANWCMHIKEGYRKKNPASTATIKILLVWVRGLNQPERDGVQNLKIKSGWDDDEAIHQLSPHNQAVAHKAKKNPHHVMTVQIFKQLSELCDNMSNKTVHIIPVAIGDPLLVDMYNQNSDAFIDNSNPDHLIQYWQRPKGDVLTGKANMLKQRMFLLEIWKNFEIIQTGVRSGMLEFLAYNGLPTIYLEREADCHDPESGADRIKQLAYELSEMSSTDLVLNKLPWFRMQHKANIGLNQYEKATQYNPKIRQENWQATGSSESLQLGFFNLEELNTLRRGMLNIYRSRWAAEFRRLSAEPYQCSLYEVESGEFGLLAQGYQDQPLIEPGSMNRSILEYFHSQDK